DGQSFAALVTSHLRSATHDMHLELVHLEPRPSESPQAASPQSVPREQTAGRANCSLEPVKILEHNIGYFKLNFFPNPSVCQAAVLAAMASLNRADAVIFDLRDTRGGFPDMVMLIAAHLFDHPTYMYNPRENIGPQLWTRSPVPGNRLADKPVFILTSSR